MSAIEQGPGRVELQSDAQADGDEAEDVALDAAGRIVAAGYALGPGGDEFALARALP